MKLLPKSPLDSSPLGRGTEREHGYFEDSDPKPELFSENEQRGSRGGERNPDASAYAKIRQPHPNHPNPKPLARPPTPAKQYEPFTKQRATQEIEVLAKQRTKKRLGEVTKGEGVKVGGENTFDSRILVRARDATC